MILQRLKCETRAEHERLEHQLDLLDDTISNERYDALLRGFYGFYAPLENRLLHRPEWRTLDFDVEPRRKVSLLQCDLLCRGFSRAQIETIPPCSALPDVNSFAQALGCLYVLEGSTLGGQILARHFARVLDIDAQSGAAFFCSYGEHVGTMWRSFGQMLTAQATSPAIEEQMIGAARSTFEALETWLCPTPGTALIQRSIERR
ncbi:MAG TPA: biliverdin-producing heme oxygenase [Abditibacteriaceae bacterium]|jgi:heme oxygenase